MNRDMLGNKSLTVRGAEDIVFLAELPQLEDLYLAGCDCSAYEVLSSLQNVKTLKLILYKVS